MKYIVFVLVLSFAPLAFSQDLNYSPIDEIDRGVATVEKTPEVVVEKTEPTKLEVKKAVSPVNSCTASKVRYLQSASRKLYRAVSGSYKIRKIGIGSLTVGDRRFTSYPESDGKVIGFLHSSHRYGYIALNTTRGHIIAKMKWKNCLPVSTKIASPQVLTPNIDLEPFKYWGSRVLWILPSKLGKSENFKESLTNIIKED